MNAFNRFCLSLAIFLAAWAISPIIADYVQKKIYRQKREMGEEVQDVQSLKDKAIHYGRVAYKEAEDLLFEKA